MNTDYLQCLLLEQANVRCVVVHIDEVYCQVRERGRYPERLGRLLGESLVVSALCSSGIKLDGRVSLQLRASGAVRLLMADCTDAGGMRGLARYDSQAFAGATDFSELTEGGVLTVTIEPSGSGRTWQGIVPLAGDSMAEAIAGYFDHSEQLPTRVVLAVTENRAAGLLVQRLPGPAGDDDGWRRACHLVETLGQQELLDHDAETVLHRLFHEQDRRLFPARPLRFYCPCSRERVARVLRGLGEDELRAIIESESEVGVDCEFCNEHYRFDRLDVERLLISGAPESDDPSPTVH